MFCFQCQETCGNTGCTNSGACGKSPSLAHAMDALVRQLKLIALNRKVSHELAIFIAESLFMTVTNTVFSEKSITSRLRRAERLTGITALASGYWIHVSDNEDVNAARELILYSLKGIAAYIVHADRLGAKDESLDDFIFYALKNISSDKKFKDLLELFNETGSAAIKAMALLDSANTEAFGSQEETLVSSAVGSRPGILISGHDLKDLYELLVQTEKCNIDIYTHGEMLAAHSYMLFKKFPNLKGHYGSAWHRQYKDFAAFNGPIIMTSNCITPIHDSYAWRIFTTNCCHYTGVPHLDKLNNDGMKDFSEVIAAAEKCPPPLSSGNFEFITGYAHSQLNENLDTIAEMIQSGELARFIVLAGCDGRHKSREYYSDIAAMCPANTVIMTAGCAKYRYNNCSFGTVGKLPRLMDAGQCNDAYSIAVFMLKLKEKLGVDDINKLPFSFDIAWYEQKAVAILAALLALGIKNIRLGPTMPAFFTPEIMKILEKNYKLKNIGTPHNDLADMLKGR